MKNQMLNTTHHLGSRLLPLALGAAVLLGFIAPASAQRLAWDTNPAVGGLGGNGNWNIDPGGTANWTLNFAGTGPNFVWPNSPITTDAVFADVASTVTVTSPFVQVANIEFFQASYLINGAGTLVLGPTSRIILTGAINPAINTPLAGLGFIKDGFLDNQLDLRGVSNFTSFVEVRQGQVKLSLGGKINDVDLVVGTTLSADFIASVLIDGPTSKWTNTGAVVIASGNNGYLTLRNGGQLEGARGDIAYSSGVNGTVTVTNAGSTWKNNGVLRVGVSGSGTLLISDDGDVLATRSIIGDAAGSVGMATVTGGGSTWTNSSDLDVGSDGTGTLLIAATGKVTSVNGILGQNSGTGTVTINGTASKWTMSGFLEVGGSGTGNLRIENDGDAASNKAFVGANVGSTGTATVTGVGSTLTIADLLFIGAFGTGTLRIEAAGQVNAFVTVIGDQAGSVGDVTVSGATSLLANTATLIVGETGRGKLTIEAGAHETNDFGSIAQSTGSRGEVLVTGAGSLWTNAGELIVGQSGDAKLRIEAGGRVTSLAATVARYAAGQGSALVEGVGSTWAVTGALTAGLGGQGTAAAIDGGKITSASGVVGMNAGSLGLAGASGAGAAWTIAGNLTVGASGTGSLLVIAGGEVSNINAFLGDAAGGTGGAGVQGAGSKWTSTNDVILGNSGTGTLRITEGGAGVIGGDAILGANAGSSGTATVTDAGSKWTIASDLIVGSGGTGLLTIRDGGAVSALNTAVSQRGTLEIGAAATLTTPTLIFAGGTLRTLAPVTFPNNAALAGAGVIVDSAGSSSTLTGVFTGAGGLTKISPGSITLTAAHTYTGNTAINEGTLILDGSLRSANVLINPGGQLAGIGTAFGHVVNNGVLSPGHSPGTFTIGGNYTQQSGGTLVIEIAGKNPGEHDLVVVGGQAALDGTLRLVNVNGQRFKVGDKVTFLTAAGGVSGKFANVENPFAIKGTILTSDVFYHANEVALEIVQGSFAALGGLTPNQRAVARTLDRVAFDPRETKLIGFLNGEPLGKLPADFDRIAPEEMASVFNLSAALANVQTANLERRMDDLRAGASGFSASGFAMSGSAGMTSGGFGLAGPEGKGGKVMVPAADNRWGVFVTGVGEFAKIGDTANARGYDLTTGGFTLGVDYKLTPNFALGVNAGYARTGIDLNHGGRITVDGGKLGLYATYFTGGFYADAAVSGGLNGYSTRRSALRGDARGSENGGELNALFATGYDWKVGALTLGPTASFQYTYASLGSFTESGSLAPLHYGAQHGESLRSAVGAKASYDWKIGGVLIRPEVRAAWQHESGTTAYAINSSFAHGGGGTFTTHGPETGRDSLLVGAGFAVQWSERTSTYVYYDGELFRSNFDSHNISGGVRVAF